MTIASGEGLWERARKVDEFLATCCRAAGDRGGLSSEDRGKYYTVEVKEGHVVVTLRSATARKVLAPALERDRWQVLIAEAS